MDPKKVDTRRVEAEKNDRKEHVAEAHDQAEKDMELDADLNIHNPNDDLDEGELARLGEDIDI